MCGECTIGLEHASLHVAARALSRQRSEIAISPNAVSGSVISRPTLFRKGSGPLLSHPATDEGCNKVC